jgi:hypothetical protein
LLFWLPRALCILYAVFISLFALDVFGEGYGFWEMILGFLIHLIPTGIVLVILAISWRWEWVGGILFIALGMAYLVTSWNKFHWSAYVVISGPLFLIGILFLVSWRHSKTLRVFRNP